MVVLSLFVRTSNDIQIRKRSKPAHLLSSMFRRRSFSHTKKKQKKHQHVQKGILDGFASRMRNGPAERRIWVRLHHSHTLHIHTHATDHLGTGFDIFGVSSRSSGIRHGEQNCNDTQCSCACCGSPCIRKRVLLVWCERCRLRELYYFCERVVVRISSYAYVVNLRKKKILKPPT